MAGQWNDEERLSRIIADSKPQPYIVVAASEVAQLVLKVNEYVDQDYVPVGGIGVMPFTEVAYEEYFQAMLHKSALVPDYARLLRRNR